MIYLILILIIEKLRYHLQEQKYNFSQLFLKILLMNFRIKILLKYKINLSINK